MNLKRCPKCCTSHGEAVAATLLLAFVLGTATGLALRASGLDLHAPRGVGLFIALCALGMIASVVGGMAFAIVQAKHRGWLR
jgi:hypothetical protein